MGTWDAGPGKSATLLIRLATTIVVSLYALSITLMTSLNRFTDSLVESLNLP